MKKELTIGLLVAALTIGLASTATAQEETSDVDVEVSSDVAIDVRPSALDYTSTDDFDALNPGAERRVSDEGFEHIELENIGSESLDEIYAQATMHDEDAFANPDNDHNTGNFVTVSTETATSESYDIGGLNDFEEHLHVNRVEYYEDNPPTYLSTLEEGDTIVDDGDADLFDVDDIDVARYRVGGAEYFVVVYSDSNNGEVAARIGDTPHTSTELGTVDFTNEGTDYTQEDGLETENPTADVFRITGQDLVSFDENEFEGGSLINDGNADLGDSELDEEDDSTEVREYNLYLDQDFGQTIRTNLNVALDSPQTDEEGDPEWSLSEETTGAQTYIVDASNDENDALQPGENFPVDIGVQVPLGVDQTTVTPGTVTILASEFEDTS